VRRNDTRRAHVSQEVEKVLGVKLAIVAALALVAVSAAQNSQTFTGTISDAVCGRSHAQMRMAPTDPECTNACVDAHGSAYVLYDAKNMYTLDGSKQLKEFAGQKVTITGTLDAKTKTVRVQSIAPAK
jgi:hypothetical protein